MKRLQSEPEDYLSAIEKKINLMSTLYTTTKNRRNDIHFGKTHPFFSYSVKEIITRNRKRKYNKFLHILHY